MLKRFFRWSSRPHTDRVLVRNGGTQSMTVIFEPWADEYPLAPGAWMSFEAESPLPGRLVVEHETEMILVWAWDRCVGRVLGPNGVVVDELTNRVPHFPSAKG